MDGEKGRRPDYNLSALSRGSEHRGKVGCAWANADGTITIKLNAFVVLAASQDLLITLFPADEKSTKSRKAEDSRVDNLT